MDNNENAVPREKIGEEARAKKHREMHRALHSRYSVEKYESSPPSASKQNRTSLIAVLLITVARAF